jgi:HAD superfamily hydrolase (TIGR01490 family)
MTGIGDAGRRPVVAAFDFDGTLSTRDNVVPFLLRVAGATGAGHAVAETAARLAVRGRSAWTRDALKAEVVRRVFSGRDAAQIEALAHAYAAEITARHLRAEALATAEWHRAQGHRLAIVSASFAVYLRPIAAALQFDAVLATELEVGPDGALTGHLDGDNVRAAEKVRRLNRWIDDQAYPQEPYVFAYGDSSGDRELWARSDRAVRLGRRAHLGTR